MNCKTCKVNGIKQQFQTFSFWLCPNCKQEIVDEQEIKDQREALFKLEDITPCPTVQAINAKKSMPNPPVSHTYGGGILPKFKIGDSVEMMKDSLTASKGDLGIVKTYYLNASMTSYRYRLKVYTKYNKNTIRLDVEECDIQKAKINPKFKAYDKVESLVDLPNTNIPKGSKGIVNYVDYNNTTLEYDCYVVFPLPFSISSGITVCMSERLLKIIPASVSTPSQIQTSAITKFKVGEIVEVLVDDVQRGLYKAGDLGEVIRIDHQVSTGKITYIVKLSKTWRHMDFSELELKHHQALTKTNAFASPISPISPIPVLPKFKIGDKVKLVSDSFHTKRNSMGIVTHGYLNASMTGYLYDVKFSTKCAKQFSNIISNIRESNVEEGDLDIANKFKIGDKVKVIKGIHYGSHGVISIHNNTSQMHTVSLQNNNDVIYHEDDLELIP